MIFLRELQKKDAPLMLEWMHDLETQKNFKKDMLNMTLADAEAFCKSAQISENPINGQSLHFAIVDEKDEYLGTISLKEFDQNSKSAEYAISVRRKARGKGIAKQSTVLLLKKAFDEYGLHRVYLNVLADNTAAIRLYEKCGFRFEGEFREHLILEGRYVNLKWYGLLDNEFDKNICGGGYSLKLYLTINNYSEGMVA